MTWLLGLLGVSGVGVGIAFYLGYGAIVVALAKAGLKWLSRRSLAEIASIALGLVCVAMLVSLKAEQRHATKLQAQITKCDDARKSLQSELDSITSAKNTQVQVTKDRIVTVTRTIHDKGVIAKRVEDAPVAPHCDARTPPEVMKGTRDADV